MEPLVEPLNEPPTQEEEGGSSQIEKVPLPSLPEIPRIVVCDVTMTPAQVLEHVAMPLGQTVGFSRPRVSNSFHIMN